MNCGLVSDVRFIFIIFVENIFIVDLLEGEMEKMNILLEKKRELI